ncbi:MAG: 16S rRNA (guanine(527)-N(7))-methyltransferase RsmG [Treponema sp.]|jgi:16S rRNA (guanine527-N7)-methyltransferase|nr:16S rRNA (guanine(527)-N(7))-methyltransferase RsmG [Treponema sp.]
MDQTLKAGLQGLCQGDPAIERILSTRFEAVLGLLNRYVEEIELFNPAYGLVGAKDRQELVVKHILDSLAPLGIISQLIAGGCPNSPPCIADVGSGAGLPGIPLAIALPQVSCTLIERSGRRVGFLRNTLAVLGLSSVAVEAGEMEKAGPGRFTLVTFRAFRPLDPAILKGLFRLLAPGGVLGAYKGRNDRIEAEMGSISKSMGNWEAIPTPVPFLEEERRMVIIKPF